MTHPFKGFAIAWVDITDVYNSSTHILHIKCIEMLACGKNDCPPSQHTHKHTCAHKMGYKHHNLDSPQEQKHDSLMRNLLNSRILLEYQFFHYIPDNQ